MKALYLKAPNQFEVRDVELRAPRPDEVIVKIKACGFCGHDKIMAAYHGVEWQPFGHEFSGVVAAIGSGVTACQLAGMVKGYENGFFYPTNRKYLYTVGLLNPHTLANSLAFSLPAANAG